MKLHSKSTLTVNITGGLAQKNKAGAAATQSWRGFVRLIS
jgi:hypothetical protein